LTARERCATLDRLTPTIEIHRNVGDALHRRRARARRALALALAAGLASACWRGHAVDPKKKIVPVYDSDGRLQLLKYDANGNGTFDTFSYMDGARVVRIEIDQDEDGRIDRWEYYDANQRLEKIGMSRANDGTADAWAYYDAQGSLSRIDVSTRRDGRVTRVEHYVKNVMVSADEDTDGDGRADKWERYDGGRLASVAFDTAHRGVPDRRLTYLSDGATRFEVDAKGDGTFTPEQKR